MICKKLFFLFFLLGWNGLLATASSMENPYNNEAYKEATGQGKDGLEESRKNDLEFSYTSEKCCCNDEILEIYEEYTGSHTQKVNPATDYLIVSLTLMLEKVDLKIKSLKNLKIINGTYSFSDENGAVKSPQITIEQDTPVDKPECRPLDFSKEEDRDWYLHNFIDKFEAGSSYTADANGDEAGGAYGRYQFVPDTGASYCQKVNIGIDCCSVWRSGGADGIACQDAMFAEFVSMTASELANHKIPLNSCNIYMAHQQGVGGLMWLRGGNIPTGLSLETIKTHVTGNVGSQYLASAIAGGVDLNDEQQLRDLYFGYWGTRMGNGDLVSEMGIGELVSVSDFAEQTENFSSLATNRNQFYREGILLELYRQKEELNSILRESVTIK